MKQNKQWLNLLKYGICLLITIIKSFDKSNGYNNDPL